ncbi:MULTISPECIES: 2,5-didehydrogluconate reductase DkgB [unclassified Cobetia]|uniref:2,5-didehydrogluconate reductase DkgB n=1 Tax=unclassified Cobetia TaxID=2609414 RepID=UPI002096D96B|nr:MULTISPECIES: 2,5-didehydrogluconate reductase DkgB [unclassified Cobetia]MCO7231706.1 2,5-didehydrogluconate reductase DkgB [Cobetia sp. Dlab-2-AX]MCO7234978.1 2,5-didehydrogluconate reductase DkgB [Cobetia sp. Dlab-2-U]
MTTHTAIPNPGLGTFRLEGDTLKQAVTTALELGYRHIDTAQMYGNEAEVGEAIEASPVPRDEIFLTTKVWHDKLAPEALKQSVDESLAKLGTDHVDLLLIHWPSPNDAVPMRDYLTALREVQEAGKARHIGVSNFTIAQIDQAVDILGEGALLTNQVEVHPFLQNRQVIEKCREHGIEVTAFMPLTVGKVMEDATLKQIAERHDASPAQVALAWLKAQDIVTFPSSTKAKNIRSNQAAFDLTLSDEEMQAIAALDRGERIADPDFAPDWD